MVMCVILTFQVHTAHIFAHTLIIIVMIVGRSVISFVFHVDNKALFMCYLLNTQIFLDSFIISAFLVSIIIIYWPARNENHVNILNMHGVNGIAMSIAVQNFLGKFSVKLRITLRCIDGQVNDRQIHREVIIK